MCERPNIETFGPCKSLIEKEEECDQSGSDDCRVSIRPGKHLICSTVAIVETALVISNNCSRLARSPTVDSF